MDAKGEKLSKQTRALPLPAEPLPALMLAWSFLDQPMPTAPVANVTEFWRWAHRAWNPRVLPPVAMLPAPRSYVEISVHVRRGALRTTYLPAAPTSQMA